VIIDVSVHPTLGDKVLKTLLGPPWNKSRLPHMLGTRYEPPFAELVAPPEKTCDRDAIAAELFGDRGVDIAVVTPLTRGLLPNPQQAAAVARAVNRWVADEWLGFDSGQRPFLGSIRLPVTNVSAALDEIDFWGDDMRFVSVAVSLRAFLPYGDETYFPIWRAAAERGLPVCVYDDASTVVEHYETPVGAMRYFTEKHAVRPFAGILHLSSLITSGTFDRLPELKFVMGDGSVDLARPMLWRIDKDWRQSRSEVPWVERPPSSYVADHVRFVCQPEDGRPNGQSVDEDLVRISDSVRLVLYGSHYPYWDDTDPSSMLAGWPTTGHERILAGNALDFFPRLPQSIGRTREVTEAVPARPRPRRRPT
jgi:uncharacterized protein